MRRSPKRLFNRRTLLSEKLGTIGSNVQTIFQANAELSIDYDRWFVAKAHSRLNWRFVATHKVGPFMTVEANPVTRAMRQPGRFVVRAKAGICQNFSRGVIDGFTRRAHVCGRKTCVL